MKVTFAEILRNLRSERNLSQLQLASKLFVSRACIASWENGRRVPDPLLITRLAEVLNVNIAALMYAAAVDSEPLNVIMVDDEEVILAGAMQTLYEVMPEAEITGFSKVSEAITFARGNRIAVAFLDIELGQHSGLDLCRTLTEINPLTNVIFLTSYPDYALKAWDTNASGFLVKPLRREDITEQLRKLRHPCKNTDGSMTSLNNLDIINFAFAITGITLAILGLILSLMINNLSSWAKSFFVIFFMMIMGDVSSDLIITLSTNFLSAEGVFFTKLGMLCETIFQLSIMLMLSLFMLHCCNEDWRRSKLFYCSLTLCIIYLILLAAAQFTMFMYHVDNLNIYHRGALYVLFSPAVMLMGINIAVFYCRRNKISPNQRKVLWSVLTILFISLIIQIFLYGIRFILIGTTIAAAIMFVYILKEQIMENARQQINIKVLEMRPHFIYNVMTSIYYLCGIDSGKAQNAIMNFTTYLQKNFNAIVKQDLIPFDEELEHTKAYLAVEKIRYEKFLFVEYDTPYRSFRLPPLTLQPIVENAVKHGIDAELSPLHIFIRTRQTKDGHEIIIEDTGRSFDSRIITQVYGENRVHIGLSNIRERLRIMCDGTLNIEPRKEGGTIVTLRLKNMNYNKTR